ncbi:hypothetical protein SAMN05444414_14614 [Roseovarius marisflavi]|uniref:Uncharacterized protein n=1 Tax=Roseovarius marisflavi TaxID=1054996 RepID=A0A1M7DQ32_9RHOB|nr:hypothetical protein SAMN05444414_14614 [Roseovarius marisflavi]
MAQAPFNQDNLAPGDRVIIRAFDDIPEHIFQVDEVHEDCVCGQALTGPFAGAYGEPDLDLILRVID